MLLRRRVQAVAMRVHYPVVSLVRCAGPLGRTVRPVRFNFVVYKFNRLFSFRCFAL